MKCIFCDIVEKKIPAKVVYETEEILAFEDITPQAPVHVLVIPKKHIKSFDDLKKEDFALLGNLSLALQEVAKMKKIKGSYRVVNNCGAEAGQSVFHLHFHILGGRSMQWPPG